MTDVWYARISEKDGLVTWQLLEDHLYGVANWAGKFAAGFNSTEWGYLAGLWHDLGKYQRAFQDKLDGSSISVEHSGLGAAFAFDKFSEQALPLAYAIAGHHTGLTNRVESGTELPVPLVARIRNNKDLLPTTIDLVPGKVQNQSLPKLPDQLSKAPDHLSNARNIEFWIRFLFSALVDADRLDAEFFDDPKKNQLRSGYLTPEALSLRLKRHIDMKVQDIPPVIADSAVNKARQTVLDECDKKALECPGIFSLTVPTGGGKTLSAMHFALKHATANNLERVIVVIPYTSIIEQNATVYKEALGEDNVIEHHSAYDPGDKHSEVEIDRHQLATENWDAPVIVTTSVQFFETLFASKPSACRKLHNIARSVIILDEVQTLPPGLLESILEAINELVSNYGCSVVLSTATPPALAERPDFRKGLGRVRDILSDAQKLAVQLQRIQYSWPVSDDEKENWDNLAAKLAKEKQVLAIVDRRADARELALKLSELCGVDSLYHLSALMCPEHRLDVIKRIKKCLEMGTECRVVSTQVIEAGVDLDFPVVYRALAGLSSIIQAAGRCNREGRLDKGRLIVFRPPKEPPVGTLRTAKHITESMLSIQRKLDVDDLQTIERFFRQLYFTQELDKHGIQSERSQLNFANVGKKFHLIEDGFTSNIIVPYGGAIGLLADIKQYGINRDSMRRLQRYVVNVYPDSLRQWNRGGALDEIVEGLFAIIDARLYDPIFGLVTGEQTLPMTSLVV